MSQHKIVALITVLGLSLFSQADHVYSRQVARPLNQVKIKVFEDKLLAIDSLTGRTISEKLGPGEAVESYKAKGVVGVAATNRRIMGFSARSGSWASQRLFGKEALLEEGVRVSDWLGLVVTTYKAYVFDPEGGSWIAASLTSFDFPLKYYLGENIGLVVTRQRALGFSSLTPNKIWQSVDFRTNDPVLDISVGDNIATLDTRNKLLVFNGLTGSWSVRERLY